MAIGLPNPTFDWKNGQIYWDTASTNKAVIQSQPMIDHLREKIIAHHFTTQEPYVFTMGPVQVLPHSRSYIEIFIATLRLTTLRAWINTAKLVAYVAASVCVIGASCYYGVKFLLNRYDLMSRGLLGYYSSSDYLKLNLIRKYTTRDLISDCLLVTGGIALVSLLPLAAFSKFGLNAAYKNSICSVLQRERMTSRIVQVLQRHPSSMSDLPLDQLANNKERQLWSDPLTEDEISEANIRSPKMILLVKHVFYLKSILKNVFSKPLNDDKICNPYINGYLIPEVQQKLVQDISTFFCISGEQFLDCWNVHLNAQNNGFNFQMKDLLALARMFKFIRLLPPPIFREHLELNSLLLQTQLNILAQLQAANSPLFPAIVGDFAQWIRLQPAH